VGETSKNAVRNDGVANGNIGAGSGGVMVIGHKNPDTDSICSAIAYARLKSKITGESYVPRRAGNVNSETEFVLNYFKLPAPELVTDVGTQVRDVEIRETAGVDSSISLKKAWSLMKKLNVVTLPILNGRRLEGLITIGDIANSYMNVYDSRILAEAKTCYANIVETIDGEMIVGDETDVFGRGKVLVAAANPDLMESYIEEGDLVILGNRYESQLCAIEMHAACIVVCDGAPVSRTIKKLAADNHCTVIGSPFDTYTVARLMNQSMPIRHFMKTENIITFGLEDFTDDIKDVMASKRYRDFPILDDEGYYQGMMSRRNLLGLRRKQVILVDHNERPQAVDGIEKADILEIIDHHRLGGMETMAPVYFRNQPLGCTATIIYQMYQEAGVELDRETAGLLCCAIISDTLLYRSPTCTPRDKETAEALAAIAGFDPTAMAKEMFTAGSNLRTKTPEEIFYQDYKTFVAGEVKVGIGQVTSMDDGELAEIAVKILPYLQETEEHSELDVVYLMLTSILEESTLVVCSGKSTAVSLLATAFPEGEKRDGGYYLKGVVSRKKQMVPSLIMAMQN